MNHHQAQSAAGHRYGAGAGVIASLAMAMYAMLAAWEEGTGFFTPRYHIASLLAPGDAMMASMQEAMSGSDFHVVFGTAILGAIVHMMTGDVRGALRPHRLPPQPEAAVLAGVGLVYGATVFAMSAFIGLPLAAIFDSGDRSRNMAEMAGWGTLISSTSSSASPWVCCSASPAPVWALSPTRLCTPTEDHHARLRWQARISADPPPRSLRPRDALAERWEPPWQCTAALPHRSTD